MYAWMLWLHIVSFVSWFAAIFYVPRQFVYHVEHSEKTEFVEVIQIMEYKLVKYIGFPAMWSTIGSGTVLLYLSEWRLFQEGGWLHAKLFFVALLIVYFVSLERFRKKLLEGSCTKSGKFFRAYNEVPTILLLLIVAMVVVRPF